MGIGFAFLVDNQVAIYLLSRKTQSGIRLARKTTRKSHEFLLAGM
jgi:hypothetical protein